MLGASIGSLILQVAAVRWPELRGEEGRGSMTIDTAVVLVVLIAVSFVTAAGIPFIGLWGLVALLLQVPIGRLLARRRARCGALGCGPS